MQLCLGTVQFGMDYGIRGQKQPTLEEACRMMDYAINNGISHIDTAKQYGTAEDVIGCFFKNYHVKRDEIFLSTKFQPNRLDDVNPDRYYDVFKEEIQNQLKRLNTDYIDAYLLHSARYVYDDQILEALSKLKKDGYTKYVGVSVYETDEAKAGINNLKVDYLQLPYSIFDQRMSNEGVFNLVEEKSNTIIDARSTFIQGLILMNEDEVPIFLQKAKPIIRKLDKISNESGISKIEMAMNFVKNTKSISSLVFGVDNIEQLKQNIDIFETEIDKDILNDISSAFKNLEADIVMPSLWKK